MQYLDAVSKWQKDFCSFQGKPFNITVIQGYVLTSTAEEAEVEQFYEDLQDWNAKEESQEKPGVTGKLGLGVQNEGKG